MALVDGLSFVQNSNDISIGVVTDTSNYGVSGNPSRGSTANYLLWSKTASNGQRDFDNPNEGNVLSTLTYQVDTPMDGLYEAILVRVMPYNNSASYVEQQQSGSSVTQWASIVYQGGQVYQCIAPVTGIAPTDPTGPTYWSVVADLSTILNNLNIHVFISRIAVNIRAENCIAKKFNASGCGCNEGLDKIRQPLSLRYQLVGADSQFANGNWYEYEKIIRQITTNCANC